MDLKQLNAFVVVADTGSMVAAASQLGLSQPSLSRLIRQLEADLGSRLLHRTGRGVSVTDSGRMVMEQARALLDQATALRQSVAAHQGQVSGQLAFGLPPSMGVYLSGPLISDYHRRYPLVHLQIGEALSGDLQERLLAHKLDLAILYDGAISASLSVLPLGREPLLLIGPADQAPMQQRDITFEQVARLPLVLPGVRHGLRALLEQYAFRESRPLTLAVEADSLRVQLDLVRRGLGFTILPARTLKALNDDGRLVGIPVLSPSLERRSVLAWRRDAVLSPATLAMRDAVLDQIASYA
ncbi:LysR family transcriptional regulator [Alcanivorax hongdengensis A-11-3]|uniref:LysR family transcriptional regulator n=1 Tax=Alcanivorax hongdengensis A-11-3 TaxID=1177179 RepID=L0WD62_9GAMM|nr:LysR family transcriptional regulator [Alcanivorax hongdengensis]EKF74052.1 LysR family transcriptional regulator [Alcanivorax hongdengensis A-11-3]